MVAFDAACLYTALHNEHREAKYWKKKLKNPRHTRDYV